MPAVSFEVRGLREAQRNVEQLARNLHGEPMFNAVRDCVLTVERGAKINAPVDTGRLRASITPEIRMEDRDIVGVVGSNVFYAAFQEFGTKFMPGKHYLQRAVDDNEERMRARIERACAQLAREASGG